MKLEQLNDAQRKAVMHGEGPLLVLAGPGSGKTFTITQRILYLIEEMQVSPEEILVITFTKDAAISMQQRFQEQADKVYPVNFGTFHSVFYHILNQSNLSNVRNNRREILRESQKKSLIYPIVKKYISQKGKISNKEEHSNTGYFSAEFHNELNIGKESLGEIVISLLSAISFYKNTGDMEGALCKLPQEWKMSFEEIYQEYERVRKQKNVIDFDDMVYECAELFQKDAQVRKYWQNRFSHILMDEFQDINPMQYRVVSLLCKSPFNLFAVGDDDQAIYGFRGSKPACLKQFVEDYHAEQVLLNINYRSNGDIISASSLVIGENKERFAKKLVAAEREKDEKRITTTLKGVTIEQKDDLDKEQKVTIRTFVEREEQYRYLIQLLSEKKDRETCAVLFRTNSYMQGFAARLQREGVPFIMKERVTSIYENRIVKDIMAYLRLAAGEKSRELWLQIINRPSRYISREALAGYGEEVTLGDIAEYYDRLRPDSAAFLYVDKIRSAIRILGNQLQYLKKMTPFLAVQYVRKVIGYESYLREKSRNTAYRASCINAKRNVREDEEWMEILDWLSEDAKNYQTLEEWQDSQRKYAEMLEENKTLREQTNYEYEQSERPVIHLMTVHASKGLEFDHVWIPDCNEKVFPHGSMPDRESCEEERRIFYVGMTRAKKSLGLLCLTGTKERPRLISRFLNPLWKKYYSSSSTTSSNSH